METMKDGGIDIAIFASHSMRSSSTSKTRIKGLSPTKLAVWTTDSTFAKFYNKPVHENLEHLFSMLNKLNNS